MNWPSYSALCIDKRHISTYTHIHTNKHSLYLLLYICIHIHKYIHTYIHTPLSWIDPPLVPYIMIKDTFTYTYSIHTIDTCIHSYIHTCIHYMLAWFQGQSKNFALWNLLRPALTPLAHECVCGCGIVSRLVYQHANAFLITMLTQGIHDAITSKKN